MEFINGILQKCLDAGADMAEVFNLSQKTLSISVRNGQVESLKKATPGGLAIRFFKDGKMAFAHTTDLNENSISEIIARLSRLAPQTAVDASALLPESQTYQKDLDIYDDQFAKEPMESKISYLMELEKLAMAFDPLIQKSQGVGYDEFVTTRTLVNSKGIKSSFDSTIYRVGMSVVAVQGEEMFPGEGSLFACHFDDFPQRDKIVEQFGSRAVRLIGGTPVTGGDYEIIFSPRAANSILWGLSGALNGENNFKGASFLSGKLGTKIASEMLSLHDDPLIPGRVATRPADDEGVATQNKTLIENGVLKGLLYDTKTAAKAKVQSTGSSFRGDYSGFPNIEATNFYIVPGKDKLDDVVASCKKGIIVEETAGWGLHGVTGEYSAGINGILVENGKRIRPVAGVTIAASADEILNGMGAICDDITYYDNFSSPSIMIKRMKVGA